MQKFSDITARAEEVRTTLGLNKSQYAARIGIQPQTYNNFVGSQGSKPNMELFHGIVREFNVNPMWLLNGTGEPFMHGAQPPERTPAKTARGKTPSGLRGERKYNPVMLSTLTHELERVLTPGRTGGTPLLNSNGFRDPRVEHAIDVILHSFWIAPVETAALAMRMIEEFERIAGELQWIAAQKKTLEEP